MSRERNHKKVRQGAREVGRMRTGRGDASTKGVRWDKVNSCPLIYPSPKQLGIADGPKKTQPGILFYVADGVKQLALRKRYTPQKKAKNKTKKNTKFSTDQKALRTGSPNCRSLSLEMPLSCALCLSTSLGTYTRSPCRRDKTTWVSSNINHNTNKNNNKL